MNDTLLAHRIRALGYTIPDARFLRPTDLFEGVLALQRHGERRVLVLGPITTAEAAHRLAEARDDGWRPVRWLRIEPRQPITARLQLRRGLA
jgi:hypothetical protein